ncbi:NAD(P)-binding protein [Zopfia rhizophila CBS 207.26]|uniref:NAD(P)-binding protein n=1 Tax=Zopfia rhizophila CBS 207.26 TaxID=1314779 RepID=A0A6A6EAT6_9PEZI|nr:NAD(P)-binding protein [Zopfia rhizophila CBS 207.26]
MSSGRRLRVGIIGCGEIAQVAHIPIYNFLNSKFRTTYLCDASKEALAHCAKMVQGGTPATTTNPEELCSSPDVDVVLICNGDEAHVIYGVLALKYDKWCLIEKPLALCYRDIRALIDAEKKSKGKVFVGTMRRYAPAFLEACEEVKNMGPILYARVRAIIGPNSNFVKQSTTYPRQFSDFTEKDVLERARREKDIVETALRDEFGVAVTDDSIKMLRMLASLNTHDLSAMREIIGMPKSVPGACLGLPGIYSALFQYDGFAVTFESGINSVPTFDAHIEVYGQDKIVRVDYDTPYVKGLPVTMTIREKIPSRPGQESFGYSERVVRRTYEDPYTLEMLEFYECVVNGKPIKTSAEDSIKELDLWKMILKAGVHNYKSK